MGHDRNFGGVGVDVGQMHGDYDSGASPDPKHVFAGKDGCYSQAGGLMLPDDIVTTLPARHINQC